MWIPKSSAIPLYPLCLTGQLATKPHSKDHLPFTESNKNKKVDALSDILSPPCCCCVSEKKIQLHKHHWSYANKHQGMEFTF